MSEPKQRDRWDKCQILLDPFGKIMTGLLVVLLGYLGNAALQEDQKRRAFVELLSRREEADGNLRKDMFSKVIDQFVKPSTGDLDSSILNLELLAYNFHESIDLGPLLKQVYAQSWTDKTGTTKQRKRLQNLAQEIVNRELAALTGSACITTGAVRFDELEALQAQPKALSVECEAGPGLPARRFNADVLLRPQVSDLRRQTELDVILSVATVGHAEPRGDASVLQASSDRASGRDGGIQTFEFAVSPFDFPLIDNVRLGGEGGRVSIVMTRVDDGGVTLTLVHFPDSRTSLRDKPFQDEVMKALDTAGRRRSW
jgi:hypothetical protein